ncbi:MAG: hypothetical protein K2H19_00620 [Ruminococcus sp.]|nr:hypothetical protein [Ruminococcus sp.]
MAEETKTPETNQEEIQQEQVKTYSEQEYNALKAQLDTANSTIKSYEDMDIDGIKASVEDYKTKYEQSENERKAFEHRTKVGGFVKSLGLKDDIYEKYVTDMIIAKELKFDGDKLIGGDDVVNRSEKSILMRSNLPIQAILLLRQVIQTTQNFQA